MKPTVNRHPIWDLPLRLFHWALVGTVVTALVGGFLLPAWWLGLHTAAGYGVIGLLVFRAIWGFAGGEFSRFDRFDLRPRAVLRHLGAVLKGRPALHPGHNPAGSAMILALLLVLIGLTVSGLLALGGYEKQGPLAAFTSFATGATLRAIHGALAVALLVLIAVHVAGVMVESLLSRDNLARAMIDGRKRLGEAPRHRRPARGRLALILFAVLLIGGGLGFTALAARPPLGLPVVPELPAYQDECGSCHHAFHPSLLPAASWKTVMDNLGDHFGDDATLNPELTATLAAHLIAHAAETSDSKAANRLREVDAEHPLRITAAPFWRATHRALPDAAFAAKAVGGKTNCAACHGDAAGGRFADQAIRVPH